MPPALPAPFPGGLCVPHLASFPVGTRSTLPDSEGGGYGLASRCGL